MQEEEGMNSKTLVDLQTKITFDPEFRLTNHLRLRVHHDELYETHGTIWFKLAFRTYGFTLLSIWV
ncbi:uncharacterized protein DS421_9g273330 [Arachis hypogaea]|nr:uncharacterized protein DS421_9g273330 [Arachis hypogaea]